MFCGAVRELPELLLPVEVDQIHRVAAQQAVRVAAHGGDQRGRDVPVGVEAVHQEAVEVVRGLAVDARGCRTGGRGGNPLLVERGVDVVVGSRAGGRGCRRAACRRCRASRRRRCRRACRCSSDRDVDPGGGHRRVTRVDLAVGQERLARPLRVERAVRGRRRGIAEHLAVEGEGVAQDVVDAVRIGDAYSTSSSWMSQRFQGARLNGSASVARAPARARPTGRAG